MGVSWSSTMEGREVATADVPSAYLHADMDDFTVLKLTGEMVGIFCHMNKVNFSGKPGL